jgi:OPT family oligopeptide transporter
MEPLPHQAQFEERGIPQDVEIPVEPFKGTPEEIERQWYEKLYLARGARMRQLTWRAIITGTLLGSFLSLANLYVGLKAGWGLGAPISACILSYAVWTVFYRFGLTRTPMTILENNCMQSAATSSASSTGATLISAFAAYIMIYGHSLSVPLLMAWVFFLALMGVTMAIPMKRQMINVDQLRFPTGTAIAETLRALHSHGEKGMRAAKALGIAGVVGAISAFWGDGLRVLSEKVSSLKGAEKISIDTFVGQFNEKVLGKEWMTRTVLFNWDIVFVAAGAITGLRVCTSMMIGATLCWAVFVPILQGKGIITGTAYRDIVQWTLWGGVSCMVFAGLFSFVLQWRTTARAFRSLARIFAKSSDETDPLEKVETPFSWFLIGQVIGFIGLAYLGHITFAMPWWETLIAVVLSFFLALIACRVTGETDTTPVGPMGKVTQMMFGVISPGKMDINLFSANITASAANSSADLLTDLKSGYLLGADPRKQFIAQFSGIFIGTVVTVIGFSLLVGSDGAVLGTAQLPAPAAQAWKAVAIALSKGLHALEPLKIWSIVIGGAVGIILTTLTKLFPKYDKYIPSANGLGLAWTFAWNTSFLFFIGSLIGYIFEKKSPKKSEEYLFSVASGVIAGGSLMGIALIFWEHGPKMWHALFGP